MLSKYIRFFIKDYFFTFFSLVFVIAYWISAYKLPFAAIQYAFVITVIACIFIVWNIFLSISEFRKIYAVGSDDKKNYDITFGLNRKKFIVIGATIVYAILIPLVGYVVSTFVYMAGLSYYLGERRPIRIILFSAIVTGFFYLVFRIWLRSRLPAGFLI